MKNLRKSSRSCPHWATIVLVALQFSGCSKSPQNSSPTASESTAGVVDNRGMTGGMQTSSQPANGVSPSPRKDFSETTDVRERFWNDEEFAKGRKLTFEILAGSPMLVVERTIYERPPFYKGPMPLKFMATKDTGSDGPGQSVTFSSDFRAWTNEFIYFELATKNYALANGARAIDSRSGRVVAEAKLVEPFIGTTKPILVEERHYGIDGKVKFRRKAHFDRHSGFKLTESEVSGDKVRDYFFLWPM